MVKIFVGDSEANSLTPDTFWCVVLKELNKESYYVFVNDHHYPDYNFDSLRDINIVLKAPISKFKEFLENERRSDNIRLVFHNGISFDFHYFENLLGISFDGVDLRDTYVLSRLANPKRLGGHSVAAWGERLGIKKVEVADEQWAYFDPIMLERCVQDVRIQEQIYNHLRTTELRGFSLKSVELEHKAEKIISQMRRDGVYLASEKALNLYATCKNRADQLESDIQKVFPPRTKLIREYNPKEKKDGGWMLNTIWELDPRDVGGPFSSFCYESFNPSSPSQRVTRLLELGWEPTEFTKPSKTHPKGQPKFTEDSLESLPEDAPQEIKLIGTYLMTRSRQALANELLNLQDQNGYIHGYVDILGAGTHRMSSNSPNLQNIPKPKTLKDGTILYGEEGVYGYECRALFCVEKPLINTFVDVDASGIQLRALAHYGGDNDYIANVANPNVDIHNVHASVLECSRSVAKTFIYALLMGAGARKLASVLGSGDPKRGLELLEVFYKRFPFLKEFKKRLDKESERGYHIALDGRLIRLNPEMPHLAMSVALQSFEAIVMKTAMVLYQETLKKAGIWFKQRIMVHDEYLVETKKTTAQEVGNSIVDSIVQAGILLDSKCPLAGQYAVGNTWAVVH